MNGLARVTAIVLTLVAISLPAYAFARTSNLQVEPLLAALRLHDGAEAQLGKTIVADTFSRPDGLLLNEFPFWNRSRPGALTSPTWELTSGSLFVREAAAWTGHPDATRPNARSTNATGSAIFRLRTRRTFGNVSVSFSLLARRLVGTDRTPARAWDGIHIFLRYQSPSSLYVVSVNRRDNTVVIKKKVPGDASNARYYTLGSPAGYRVPFGDWQHIRADVVTARDGTVTIALFSDEKRLLRVTDGGTGGPPLGAPGRVGIRGDNAEFLFDDFVVRRITARD